MKKIISPENGNILAVAREVGGVLHVSAGEELLNWADWVNAKEATFDALDTLAGPQYRVVDFAPDGPEALVEFKQVQAIENFFRGAVEFEVKAVRALWDPNLGPKGGWRCPPGTPAAGQWTNRFGTNCAVPGLGPKLGGRRGLISRLADIVDPDKPTPGGGQAGLVLSPPGKKPKKVKKPKAGKRKTGSKPKPSVLLEFLDGLKDRAFTPRGKPKKSKKPKRQIGGNPDERQTPILDWLINLLDPEGEAAARDNAGKPSAQDIVDDYFDDEDSGVPGTPKPGTPKPGTPKPGTPKKPKPDTPKKPKTPKKEKPEPYDTGVPVKRFGKSTDDILKGDGDKEALDQAVQDEYADLKDFWEKRVPSLDIDEIRAYVEAREGQYDPDSPYMRTLRANLNDWIVFNDVGDLDDVLRSISQGRGKRIQKRYDDKVGAGASVGVPEAVDTPEVPETPDVTPSDVPEATPETPEDIPEAPGVPETTPEETPDVTPDGEPEPTPSQVADQENADYILDIATSKDLDQLGDLYEKDEDALIDSIVKWDKEHNNVQDDIFTADVSPASDFPAYINAIKKDVSNFIDNPPDGTTSEEIEEAKNLLKDIEKLEKLRSLNVAFIFAKDDDERRSILKDLAKIDFKKFWDHWGKTFENDDSTPEPDAPEVPEVPEPPVVVRTPDAVQEDIPEIDTPEPSTGLVLSDEPDTANAGDVPESIPDDQAAMSIAVAVNSASEEEIDEQINFFINEQIAIVDRLEDAGWDGDEENLYLFADQLEDYLSKLPPETPVGEVTKIESLIADIDRFNEIDKINDAFESSDDAERRKILIEVASTNPEKFLTNFFPNWDNPYVEDDDDDETSLRSPTNDLGVPADGSGLNDKQKAFIKSLVDGSSPIDMFAVSGNLLSERDQLNAELSEVDGHPDIDDMLAGLGEKLNGFFNPATQQFDVTDPGDRADFEALNNAYDKTVLLGAIKKLISDQETLEGQYEADLFDTESFRKRWKSLVKDVLDDESLTAKAKKRFADVILNSLSGNDTFDLKDSDAPAVDLGESSLLDLPDDEYVLNVLSEVPNSVNKILVTPIPEFDTLNTEGQQHLLGSIFATRQKFRNNLIEFANYLKAEDEPFVVFLDEDVARRIALYYRQSLLDGDITPAEFDKAISELRFAWQQPEGDSVDHLSGFHPAVIESVVSDFYETANPDGDTPEYVNTLFEGTAPSTPNVDAVNETAQKVRDNLGAQIGAYDLLEEELFKIGYFWEGYDPAAEYDGVDFGFEAQYDDVVGPYVESLVELKGEYLKETEIDQYATTNDISLQIATLEEDALTLEDADEKERIQQQIDQLKAALTLSKLVERAGMAGLDGPNNTKEWDNIKSLYGSLSPEAKKKLRLKIDKRKNPDVLDGSEIDETGIVDLAKLSEKNADKFESEIYASVNSVLNGVPVFAAGEDMTDFEIALQETISSPSISTVASLVAALNNLRADVAEANDGELSEEQEAEFERILASAQIWGFARLIQFDADYRKAAAAEIFGEDEDFLSNDQLSFVQDNPFSAAKHADFFKPISPEIGKFYRDATDRLFKKQDEEYIQKVVSPQRDVKTGKTLPPDHKFNKLSESQRATIRGAMKQRADYLKNSLKEDLVAAGIVEESDFDKATHSEIVGYVSAANMSPTMDYQLQQDIIDTFDIYSDVEFAGAYSEGDILASYDEWPSSQKAYVDTLLLGSGLDINDESLYLDAGDESDTWVDVPTTQIEDQIPDTDGTAVPEGPVESEKIKEVIDPLETIDIETLKGLDPHSEDGPWGPKKPGEHSTYGVIYVDNDGKILLREPLNHHDLYHWTFPKGTPDPGEKGVETALREGLEETGITADPVGFLPGGHKSGSSTTYFVIAKVADVEQLPMDNETQDLAWVTPAEAIEKIKETQNMQGRKRDLGIVDALKETLTGDDPASVKWINGIPVSSGDDGGSGFSFFDDPIVSSAGVTDLGDTEDQLKDLIGTGKEVTLKNPKTGDLLTVELEDAQSFDDASFGTGGAAAYFRQRLTTQMGNIDSLDVTYEEKYASRLAEIETRLKEVEEGRKNLSDAGSLASIGDPDIAKFNTLARKEFFRSQALDIVDKKREAKQIGESEILALVVNGEIKDSNASHKIGELEELQTTLNEELKVLIDNISNDESVDEMSERFKKIREREIAISRIDGNIKQIRSQFAEVIKNQEKQISAHKKKHAATGFTPKNPQDLINPPDAEGAVRHRQVTGIASIDTPEKASQHLLNGGSLDDIPDALLRDAIMGDLTGEQKRFKKIGNIDPGINGAEGSPTFMFRDTMNSDRIYILKRPVRNHDEHLSEAAAASIGARLGLPMTGMRILGDPYQHTNTVPGSMIGVTTTNRSFLMEHSDNVVESGQEGSGVNGTMLARAALLHHLIKEPDNHGSNRITRYDATGRKYVMPFDHGKAFLDWDVAKAGHEHGGLSESGGIGGTVLSLLQSDEKAGTEAIRELRRIEKILKDDPDFLIRDIGLMEDDIVGLTESEIKRIKEIQDVVRAQSEILGDAIDSLTGKLPYEVKTSDASIDLSEAAASVGDAFMEHKNTPFKSKQFTIALYGEDDIADNQILVQSKRKVRIDGENETASILQFRWRGAAVEPTTSATEGKQRFDDLHNQAVLDGWELVSTNLVLEAANSVINTDNPKEAAGSAGSLKNLGDIGGYAGGRIYRKKLSNGDIALLYLDDDFSKGTLSVPYGKQYSSAHGLVRVVVRGTAAQRQAKVQNKSTLEEILSQVGVKSHGMPSDAHIDSLARTKLARTLSRKENEEEALQEIQEKYGIGPTDMTVRVDPHTGQLVFELTDDATDKVMSVHGIPEDRIVYHQIGDASVRDMIESSYMPPLHRLTYGFGTGKSPMQDIVNGGGEFGYYYQGNQLNQEGLYFSARQFVKLMMEGFGGGSGMDVWGAYYVDTAETNAEGLSPSNNSHHLHSKLISSPALGAKYKVGSQVQRQSIIDHFKSLGVNEIGGIPIEEIVGVY